MTENEEQLRRMVMTFRVSELQMLLGFAGKNKIGRKNELQSRAIEVVKLRNPAIQAKIKKLYKNIQLEMMSFGDRSQVAASAPTGILPAQKAPMSLSTIPGYTQPSSVGNLGVSSTLASSRYSSSSSQVATPGLPSAGTYPALSNSSHIYPVNPDVKLKKLPFYDIISELLKPSTLSPQIPGRYPTFAFSFSSQQANKIANSRDLRPGKQDYCVQVQMRFCLLETTCDQEDNFPPNVAVKINDKMCPLPTPIPTNKPGVEPKRPSRPVNVTALCRISPTVNNTIQVSWSSEYGQLYVISVYLVQKLTSDDLLLRLKNKGAKLPDFTRSLIKQKLEDADCEIATTSLRCSLMCPLGKMRMVMPCRASTCDHLQCFDASLFLQMNERKPTWTCPVCDKQALYDCLVIDGYFQEVLKENSCSNEVTLHKDGSWTPLMPKKEAKEPEVSKPKMDMSVETLSDESDDSSDDAQVKASAPVATEGSSKKRSAELEIITLSDSDDDDDDDVDTPPPAKRPNTGQGSAITPAVSVSCNGTSGLLSASGVSSSGLTFSLPSSGSVSPQVICLDSPTSSPSPPTRRVNKGPSPLPAGTTMTLVSGASVSSSGSSEQRQIISITSRTTPPVTTTTTTSSRRSPTPHTIITPISSACTTSSSQTVTSASSFLPTASTPSFNIRPTSSAAAAAAAAAVAELTGISSNPFSLSPTLQNLFTPLGLMPPSTVSNTLPYRPQDRYM